MKLKTQVVVLALSLSVAGSALAQAQPETEKKPDAAAAAGAAGGPSADEMAKWQAHMTPGEGHKVLEATVGKFEAASTWQMAPDAPPMTSKGTSESTWVLGNRFVEQRYKGDMMGQAFDGLGYTGYDNTAKVYNSTWMDSMTTSIMVMNGTYDAAKKELVSTGESVDPMTGGKSKMRTVLRIESNDKHVFEMYAPGPDGKEFKAGEIIYTRLK